MKNKIRYFQQQKKRAITDSFLEAGYDFFCKANMKMEAMYSFRMVWEERCVFHKIS